MTQFKKMIPTLVLLCLTSCSRQEEVKDLTPEVGYIIVTDYLGRQVKVKEDIEHIGSLFAGPSHIIAMLGDADKIVAITQGNIKDLLFCEIYPEIHQARVVKRSNVINIEEIAKKPRPDVFIVNPEVALDEGQIGKLKKLKIPIITFAYRDMQQQLEMVELLGKVIGRNDEAKDFVDYYKKTVERVASRTADIPDEEKKTVYHAINELLRTDQHDTLSTDWLNHLGVKNVAVYHEKDEGFKFGKNYMALEELFERNPEVIIINGGDVYDYIQHSKQLHNLKAYREGNIHLLPLGITRWGHPFSIETPLAMLWTAKTIYPDRFKDVDIEKETRDFYRTFFNYELSDFQLNKILSGRGYKEIKGSGR